MADTEKYIMALDEGTSSCRTLIIDKKGAIKGLNKIEILQQYPQGQSGWVEHDPIEIWNSQLTTMIQALNKSKINSNQITAIGITNQRETTVVWNRETGLPVYNAIVWQDRRTAQYCESLIKKGWKEKIRKKTGLLLDAYFSATKIKWILDNVPEAKQLAQEGKLAFGTIDSWLIYKMTAGINTEEAVHVIDITNASRTMLFNINTNSWDQELLTLFEIPESILPKVVPSSGLIGKTYPGMLFKNDGTSIPICSAIGDQHAALFGQLCLTPGEIKTTYGTGCFIMMNIGKKPILSDNNLLTTVAYQLENQAPVYAIEGSVFIAGAAIQFLRDSWRMLYRSDESLWYADIIDPHDQQRVYFVPAFVGLGAPYWDSTARGAIFGLERATKREHIVKATLESLAYQTYDIIRVMKEDIKKLVKKNFKIRMKVDGGASNNSYVMQFQSDISNTSLIKPKNIETTAMGAAYLAGLAIGFWKNLDEIKKIYQLEKEYHPIMEAAKAKILYKGWQEAVKRTRNWTTAIE
ncbi:Glycerol kinase [Spiroplasma sp. JKS002671]|uniref:glycerol kinase GlpK n=1 Tax=Spiroplasma attinicola TaxID=2904537 RepID=UPI0020229D65|nr:glycerol kinase GlpK [Spiroplasma sp. JKS002671]MCL8210768.1 Glycerol kinase [Spiroplasma sp. JKS002671]